MKKVNKDKYDINLGKCGSPAIYPVEYKCTNAETVVTKINIEAVTESNISPIDTFKLPDSIHVHNFK